MSVRLFRKFVSCIAITMVIAGCTNQQGMFPTFSEGTATTGAGAAPAGPPPPVIRQPVLPEYLVGCRGHVLVPALGMTFVPKNAPPPTTGQYLREERLTVPYRVIRPGDRLSQDRSTQRLNVELDSYGRVVGLACG
jgi:hypothetical protein